MTVSSGFSGQPMRFWPVTGAPYCADGFYNYRETLSDGTHAWRTQNVFHISRDSAGRIRRERWLGKDAQRRGAPDPRNGIKLVQIEDPVTGFEYTLDTRNKGAHRVKMLVQTASPPRAPAANTTKAAESHAPFTYTVELLGDKTMEGVRVTGTLHKWEYDAGSDGIVEPFTVTDEIWESPDLKVTVLQTRCDPRFGHQANGLENITLVEADPALFQVPADYRIVDETTRFHIHLKI